MTLSSSSSLSSSLPGRALDQEEQRRAVHILLQNPLLCAHSASAAEFALVRRHAKWLREWFARYTGWVFHLDSEHARLRKTPAALDNDTHPARDRNDQPFTRRRYMVLCLALAALERADKQVVLGRLAETIVGLACEDESIARSEMALDLAHLDHRRDLVHAIRLLLDLRVLTRMDGDEQHYLAGKGDVLYNVNRPVLASLLNVKRGPSTIPDEPFMDRLQALSEEMTSTSEEMRNRAIRHNLMRRLIDDPVVYHDELPEEERNYLKSQRVHLLRILATATEFVPEVRSEGLALVDDSGEWTDLKMPDEGTDGHLTLLLAEFLAGKLRSGETLVNYFEVYEKTDSFIEEHRHHWRKGVAEEGAGKALTDQSLRTLAALKLIRLEPAGIIPRSAIARFRVGDPKKPGSVNTSKQGEFFAEAIDGRNIG